MKYLYTFLILLLSNTLSYSQVNQSKSICSGATINLTSDDFGLPDTTTYTWNFLIATGNITGASSSNTASKNFNQTLYATGNIVGVVVFNVTPSYGNPFTITVRVNPTNMIVDVSALAPSICSNGSFYAEVGGGVPANTKYTWNSPAVTGGFVDGAGGGGWGPVVTTSLLGGKMLPKKVIGTVNASEFFINLASATTFVFLVKITDWEALAGLIIGGFLIAPYAAKATSRMSVKMILTVVGCLIIIISLRKIITLFL